MSKFAQGICVFTMTVTGLLAQTTATPTVELRTSGVVGIAQGQTARFNVLNPAPAVSVTSTTAAAPAACTAVLTYHDAVGALLKTSTVTVAPGTAGYLDLFSDVDLALVIGQRRQIRVTFSVPLVPAATATATPTPACQLIGTLEIFDAITGRADVVLGGMHVVRSEIATPVTASPAN
jgi:hypothetical protein